MRRGRQAVSESLEFLSEEHRMLWPLVLPFLITLGGMVAVLVFGIAIAPKCKKSRKRFILCGLLLSGLAFVPSCTVLMTILDQYRFGVFKYADYESVNDLRVERFLPEAATEITIDKSAGGYRAKFSISRESLDSWYDESWNRNGDSSVVVRDDEERAMLISTDDFEIQYGDLGWPPLADAIEYVGPAAPNGAGFTIWYCEAEGVAYQHVGYW
jgi:hypothetical protein